MTNIFFRAILLVIITIGFTGCASTKKPIKFAAPYQHGQYSVTMLDIQPGEKFKEKIANSEYEAQTFQNARQKIIKSLMPKLASRPNAMPVGLLIYIDDWEINTVMQGSLNSRIVLWHPQAKTKVAEMRVGYQESQDKDSTLGAGPYYSTGGIGGLIATGLVVAYQGISKHMKGEEEINRQIDVYTDNIMKSLYPVISAKEKAAQQPPSNKAKSFLVGR